LNLFLMKEWKLRDSDSGDVRGTANEDLHLCVVEEDSDSDREAVVIAHELGHLLGLDHTQEGDALMFSHDSDPKENRRLLIDEIRTMRKGMPK
jgi:Zn-dependent peptidase ImmA (M78 family)